MPPEENEGVQQAESPTADVQATDSGVTEAGSPPATDGGVTPESPAGSDEGQSVESYKEGLIQAATEAAEQTGSQPEEGTGDQQDQDSSEQSEQQKDKDEDEDEGAEKDEDGKKLPPFHKHPRWQEMVRERNQLREQVEQYKTGAQEYQKIQSFMDENGLTTQQVAQAIQTVALMKKDPASARQALAQELDVLDRQLGEKLPDDLQRDVEEGYVTEERAKELARLRNQQTRTQQQVQEERRRAQQQQERFQRQQGQQALQQQQQAVRSWEQNIKSRDPDFERIQPLVYKELRLLTREGMDRGRPPRTPDEAVQLAERAYNNVKEQVRKIQPRPATRSGPSSKASGGTAGSSAQPQSLQDAVIRAAGLG